MQKIDYPLRHQHMQQEGWSLRLYNSRWVGISGVARRGLPYRLSLDGTRQDAVNAGKLKELVNVLDNKNRDKQATTVKKRKYLYNI